MGSTIQDRETDPGRLQQGRRQQVFNGAFPADISDMASVERTARNAYCAFSSSNISRPDGVSAARSSGRPMLFRATS